MRTSIAILASFAFAVVARGAAEADLLVAYDNSFSDGVGGDANAEVLAANGVAGSNAVNERSGTPARMRIVGYHKTWWQGGRSTLGGYVGWMGNYGDGELNDITTAADNRGADLVAYICAPNSGETAAAVAQQPGRYAAYGPGNFWSNLIAHETGGHNYDCDHRDGKDNPKTIMLHNYCGGGAQGYFSNPNIWLNGVKLLGTGSCLGGTVNGGDNAYLISTTAQGVADRNTRLVTAPNLASVVRRWSFNQAAGSAMAGTTVIDSVSGTALATVQGVGATFTGKGLRLPGGASGSTAAYLQLPSGVLSSHTNITLEIWATPLSAPNWSRLMDFNNGTSNYLMLALSRGTNLNDQRFESKVGATTVGRDSAIATVAGLANHYAITFTDNGAGGGSWKWYRNGDEVAYLDVTSTLSALQDVNAWLGRSAYAGDSFAHCEYAEVRVSNVAMTRDQVFANYRLGPNRQGANVTLTADDPLGQASFNSGGLWSDSLAPGGGKSYETYGFRLRTPADGTSRTFAGQSLRVTGGGITYKGTSSSTTIFNNLTFAGNCEMIQAGSGTWNLAGSLAIESDEAMIRAANGPVNLSANLSGSGSLLLVNNTVTASGSNGSFAGRTLVGDGRLSGLAIDSEARLGGNPSTFTADQLTLNRGILYTSATTTLDDVNRGIRIGASAGLFNVAAGTTLTLAVPLSSPSSGEVLQTVPLYPNPVVGMFVKENSGTLVLSHPNNSHTGEIVINGGGFTVSGAGRLNNGDHVMPITNNGTLTFNSSAGQILGGVISGGGPLVKGSTGMLSLTVGNTFTGAVTVNGGTLYANVGNAANNRSLSFVSGITVNSGGTLRSSTNSLFGWDGTQDKPITVNAGGTLLADGGATGDVGVGTVTLAGGTLASTAASTVWGTWRFDDATDKLLVTETSTASATNVKFGNAAASIEVASGKTLNFTGTITNATSGGISYLTKTGTGTLALTGSNTHTGATAINAGTVTLNGSLAAGSAVTVAGSATLSGTGTVNGALAFATNAIHAPGNPAGTQTIAGALNYANGSRVRWTLPTNNNANGAASRIAAGNVTVTAGTVIDLVLNGAGSTVNFTDTFWTQSRTWNVMTCSNKTGNFSLGTISGDAAGRPVSNYGTLSLQQNTTTVSLVFTPYTLAELWRQANFGANWNNPDIAGDIADPDNDGIKNLLERAFSGNPNASESNVLPAVDATAPLLSINYRKAKPATDLTFTVQESDFFAAWVTATGTSEILSDDGTVQVIRFTAPPGSSGKKFLRVQITGP